MTLNLSCVNVLERGDLAKRRKNGDVTFCGAAEPETETPN